MDKIKGWLHAIGEKMKSAPKGRQSKAFVRVLQFFAVMLALTIFARGAAGVTMPEVQVQSLSQQNIRVADDYAGTVTAANKVDIKMPTGLTVSRVYVSLGATVKTGDQLVSFDTSDLQRNLTEQRITLQELKLALAELQKPRSQDSSALDAAKQAKNDAQYTYDTTKAAGEQAVADAESKLALAKQALEDYINQPPPAGSLPASSSGVSAPSPEKIDELQGEIDAAEVALATAKSEAESSLAAAKRALDRAKEDLAKAQEAYDAATPSYNIESQKNELEISKKKQEIADQEELVSKLSTLIGDGGDLLATVDGTVTAMTVSSSAVTADTDYVRISTGVEGFIVEFPVSQDKVRDIRIGSIVNVRLGQYYYGYEARVTGRGVPNESGQVTMRAQLTSNDWSEGDAVTVSVVFSDNNYWNAVPLAAVRSDSASSYVLVLEDSNTVLGEQTVARRVDVTVQDKDNNYAAIEGIYDSNTLIIVSSTKPVNDGDMVRIAEESTK